MALVAERVRVPHRFTPRPYQVPLFAAFDAGIRRFILVHHRRAGKDKACFNLMVREAATGRVGNYYYAFPTHTQGQRALWRSIDKGGMRVIDHCPPELLAKPPTDGDMRLELKNGSTVEVLGTLNPDSLRGANPVGIVFSEYSWQSPQAWEIVEPILLENEGWAAFNYTPQGQNHAYDLYENAQRWPDWFVSLKTVDDTGAFTPEQLEQAKRGKSDEYIQQEYYCSFEAGNVGSYYGRLLADAGADGRIGRVPYETGLPVHTRWDLGVGDATAIWCWQDAGRERRFIDFYENSGEGLPHYVGWLQRTGYVFGRHYAPHDIGVREFSSGVSRLDTARNLGIRFEVVKQHSLEDGIEAVRQELPRCWFDAERCKPGLAALRAYAKDYDEARQVYRDRPRHDWASHGADAFRTGSMGHTSQRGGTPPSRRQLTPF